MKVNMRCHEVKELPKLAWIASHELGSGTITVCHGSAVEYGDTWIVEGVWDNDFHSADFHTSDIFFGSGIRVDDETIHFVPSRALVDRIVYCRNDRRLIVSNSLVVLMAHTGARLNLEHDYRSEAFTILDGVKKYKREFSILHPEITCFYQLFRHNLLVTGEAISFSDEKESRPIRSFAEYHGLMTETLERIRRNYESSDRKHPVSTFTTMSSGYDSTAVSALVSKIGVDDCFTSKMSNSILPAWLSPRIAMDDGSPVAESLGYTVHYLDHDNISEDELYFLAASCAGPESVYYSLARKIYSDCQVGLVFTGYHGDVMWDLKLKPGESGGDIIRGDTSGFNLAEIRLKSGFIHVPVPFMYASSVKDVVGISLSEEMFPWRLFNDYDRPVARRILETSGVPRNYFGFRKKGVTRYYNYPKNMKLRRRFFTFLKQQQQTSSLLVYAYAFFVHYPVLILMGVLYNIGLGKIIDKNRRPGLDLSRKMFVWAANSLAETTAHDCNGFSIGEAP
ncbi:MAG: hypothetical protein ACOZF0_00690 [Thermodesulfobacteriota bacterium]